MKEEPSSPALGPVSSGFDLPFLNPLVAELEQKMFQLLINN